jgi:hypothetical protein
MIGAGGSFQTERELVDSDFYALPSGCPQSKLVVSLTHLYVGIGSEVATSLRLYVSCF